MRQCTGPIGSCDYHVTLWRYTHEWFEVEILMLVARIENTFHCEVYCCPLSYRMSPSYLYDFISDMLDTSGPRIEEINKERIQQKHVLFNNTSFALEIRRFTKTELEGRVKRETDVSIPRVTE